MQTHGIFQRLAAEFSGTFVVVLFSAGAICAGQFLRNAHHPGLGPLPLALAYGLSFGAMVIALGPISGGHFNPAVSLGFWVTRQLDTSETVAYWIAQFAGSVVAAYALRYAVPEEVWRAVALGTPDLASGLTRIPAMSIEALMAFCLTLAFLATAKNRLQPGVWTGMATAGVIVAAYLLGAPFTGASMNPARAFGPALVSSHWTNHGLYWVGPLTGGVLAAWLWDALFLRTLPQVN